MKKIFIGAVGVFIFVSLLLLGSNKASALSISDIQMLQAAGIISLNQAQNLVASMNASANTAVSTPAPTTNTSVTSNTSTGDVNPAGNTSCIAISNSMGYGARDARTNGEVSIVQDFLQANNYLSSNPSGFFGLMTQKAVSAFQSANGINPTGYIGPMTKAKIQAVSCNGVTSVVTQPVQTTQTVLQTPTPTPTPTPTAPATSQPTLFSISNNSVNPGDTVTITGSCLQSASCGTLQTPTVILTSVAGDPPPTFQVNPVTVTGNSVTFSIPSNIALPYYGNTFSSNGSYNISLRFGSIQTNTLSVTVLAPTQTTNPQNSPLTVSSLSSTTYKTFVGTVNVDLGSFQFTNNSQSPVTVSGITLTNGSQNSDSVVGNVTLYGNGSALIGGNNFFANGSISFLGSNVLTIPAGASVTIKVQGNANAAGTVTIGIAGITASAPITVNYPVNGYTIMVTGSQQPVASLTPTISSVSGVFNPGISNTVYGTNLSGITTVSLTDASGKVSVVEFSPTSNTTFGVDMPSSPALPTGSYTLSVTTANGSVGFPVSVKATQPTIVIKDVQYSPASPKINDWITTTVVVANTSNVDQTLPFRVNVQGTTVTINSLAAGTQKTVTVSNAFTFSYAGDETLNTAIIDNNNMTGNVFTNTITFTSPTTKAPVLTSVTPVSGSVNTQVTIYGSNLGNVLSVNLHSSNSSNTIGAIVPNSVSGLTSSNTQVTFTIKQSLFDMVASHLSDISRIQIVTPGGTSNDLPFTLTGAISDNQQAPSNVASVLEAFSKADLITLLKGLLNK